MFNKLTWYIAFRYLTARHESGFINFITGVSIIGVTLGIAVLILVLSVMNGFKKHVEFNMLKDQKHIYIESHTTEGLSDTISKLSNLDTNINAITPAIYESSIIKFGKNIIPINIISKPDIIKSDVVSNESSSKGKKSQKTDNSYSNKILISADMAMNYGFSKGDQLILAAPILRNSIMGPQARFKKFTIGGLIGEEDEQDRSVISALKPDVEMPYELALRFFNYPDNYLTGLYLSLSQPLLASNIKESIQKLGVFDSDTKIQTWQENNETLFQAIRIERLSIVVLLLIIIAVACFNIISGLYIQVSEKQKDVAILRTLGISKQEISSIFILQGIFVALIGGLFGTVIGCMLTQYLDSLVFWLQRFSLIDGSNSFFNAISTHIIDIKINYIEVAQIFIMSFGLCLFAAMIPALKSSKIIPLEALRDE